MEMHVRRGPTTAQLTRSYSTRTSGRGRFRPPVTSAQSPTVEPATRR